MRRSRTTKLQYQTCETRRLLAVISLNDGELLLGGEDSDDVGVVSISGNQVTASLTGADTASFPLADVNSIRFVGLDGDDQFTNETSIPSFAFGLGGNDILIGGPGDDLLVGGTGNDELRGNDGDDIIRGGLTGTKTIFGGPGNDRLFGGSDTNTIRAGAGNDEVYGGNAMDTIFGEEGDDELYPGHGENWVDAGDGDDFLVGGRDVDTVFGGNGNDRMFPGLGDDIAEGGAGDDWIGANDGDDIVRGGSGADRLNGGNGNDRIEGETGNSAGLFEMQNLSGGEGDDVVIGGDQADRARGDAGNDTIDLRGGNDFAFGGSGDDTITLGNGNDYAEGNDGEDLLEGGNGNDDLVGGADDDRVVGGSGQDSASYIFNQSRFRIAGSDLFVSDLNPQENDGEGKDDVDGVERLRFADGAIDAESQIREVVTIQPIIVSNSNGSNTAEFFGTDEQETEIKSLINDIWYQARIQVNWLTPNTWNNTFANVGNGGTRPANDAFEIFDRGDDAGVSSSNQRVVNMYFVEIVPGSANQPENRTNGLSLDGANGVTFQVGDELPTFEGGREAIARVASHEVAHNLGLEHVSGNGTNLMNFPNITSSQLTAAQSRDLIDSEFSR